MAITAYCNLLLLTTVTRPHSSIVLEYLTPHGIIIVAAQKLSQTTYFHIADGGSGLAYALHYCTVSICNGPSNHGFEHLVSADKIKQV